MKRLSRSRLSVCGLLEPLVRLVALLASLVGRDRHATENAVRGLLLGGRKAGWRIGRRVDFIGPANRISMGRDVTLYGRTVIDANGPRGEVTIGHRTHVDHLCLLYGQGGLRIGSDCAIAGGVMIYTQTNADSLEDGTPVARQPTVYTAVEIGDGCWLGAGAQVIPGVKIGAGAHVGAGAVVLGDVPGGDVVVGVPARTVKKRPTWSSI